MLETVLCSMALDKDTQWLEVSLAANITDVYHGGFELFKYFQDSIAKGTSDVSANQSGDAKGMSAELL